MKKFLITTDSSCDGKIDELKNKGVNVIYFNYSDEKNIYEDKMDEKEYKAFYDKIRNGTVFKTAQINPQRYYDFFKPLVKENLPIIHVSLGSGLSNTINSIYIAISMLKEEYPNCDIRPIDSKIASLGLTMMVDKLVALQNEGVDANQAFETVNSQVLNIIAYYTTDTLTYFARGGRLSKVEAFIGNTLKINPLLDCTPEGGLRITDKTRGSRRALEQLVKRVNHTVINPQEQTVLICHADNETRGRELGEKLVKECGFKDYRLFFMGPIIGAHTGPGLIAAFFIGKTRNPLVENVH